ncbi:ABC transporter substrate-binding protein [Alcanivorax marinus]|uniref:ABC transporter substrate-binding protein n=1 Tax=Alloalcanivorax marinus TaxID=1177169 RepID=A0A9Q3YNA0_9GAMM|nr:ABC transporter substrate-binding protein [Alloalcanivorax marinus]MBM7334774.1 ABC transporter substrate-binding protein [Alloalcanivorax marinus]MCC4309629.1 ABC transporter substrate-binding protein [Alloalcanivorax marinus]MCH2557600.1 ABC transporter substrate-binding protein [Alcanivorax sp.]MCU5786417.1 high-affinity branched-chain amino acid transport ATP-binding protein LivF [Alloalcanivorax marinus]
MKLTRTFRRLAVASAVALTLGGVAQAEEVTIGFTGPLSGGAALYGENTVEGLRMAATEINEAGGFDVDGENYTIKIEALDDKYSPSQAAVNGKRLVQQYKAPIIFTPHSGGTFALQAFNERDGFLVMSYTSVPAVTAKGNKLTVKIPPNFTDYLVPFAKITMDRFGKNMAVANATHDYAKYWTKEFVPVWRKMGGEVVATNPMDYNKSADYYTGVSKVLAEKPDVMFVGGASEPTGLVVRQARELGFKGGFVIMDQAKIDEVAKVSGGLESLEGSVGVVPLADYNTPGAERFVKLWTEKHDGVATSETAYHYFAMYLLMHAMQEAGSVDDPAAIRAAIPEALKDVDPKHNPYDVTAITDDGNLGAEPQIAEVKDGKVVIRETRDYKE